MKRVLKQKRERDVERTRLYGNDGSEGYDVDEACERSEERKRYAGQMR